MVRKKSLAAGLVLIIVLMIGGCSRNKPQRDAYYAGIISGSSSGLIVTYDHGMHELARVQCARGTDTYFDSEKIGVVEDGHWHFYDFMSLKDQGEADISGELLYYGYDGAYVSCEDDELTIVRSDGSVSQLIIRVSACYIDQANFYYLDGYNYLHILPRDTLQESSAISLNQLYVESMTTIGQITYLVTYDGITPIIDGRLGFTYIFTENFDDIGNAIGDHLFVYEGEEMVAYKLEIGEYRLTMTLEKEEEYYQEINFHKLYEQEMADGYELIGFYEKGIDYGD